MNATSFPIGSVPSTFCAVHHRLGRAIAVLALVLAAAPPFAFGSTADCPLPPGDPGFCTECGPCGEGEGGCRGDDQCAARLICAENFGRLFDLPRTVDVCLTPRSLPLVFTAVELPSISTPEGTVPVSGARAMNNAGQVVGTAVRGTRTVAFRFSPGAGMETLAPEGYDSEGLGINERGDVFGALLRPESVRPTGFFLYRDGTGFDFLDEGANNLLRQGFTIHDLNDAGDLVGSVRRWSTHRLAPYLYTAATGWVDLSLLDPRFRQKSTYPIAINNAGDVLLTTDPLYSNTTAFLLHGAELFEIGDLGEGSNYAQALGEKGHVGGGALVAGHDSHAYFLPRPAARLVDIHPRRFSSSRALSVTAKGVVGGVVTDWIFSDTLFTWDRRRSPKMRLEVRRTEFESFFLLPLLLYLDNVRMNERLEFVGTMTGVGITGEFKDRFFYFSPPHGLYVLRQLLDQAGVEAGVVEVIDFNDWGEILLRVAESTWDTRVVILSPGDD